VAGGPTREAATARLLDALAATTIDLVGATGPAATNLAFLRKVLVATPFVSAIYDTTFAEALAKEAAKA
jgi:acetyl-CoA carboxylase biotin carboxylase subunit/3-methylcrotonyl-CoA carboxylase alpha subunit